MAAGDATAEGIVRLVYSDASETSKNQAMNLSTQELDLATDPRQLQVLAFGGQVLAEDDKLIMEFFPTAAAGDVATDPTESATHSLIRVPVTVKNVRTGNKFERTLTSNDFQSAAANYSCSQNAWTAIGTYTVGAQEEVRLGHINPVNSRVRIELKTAA